MEQHLLHGAIGGNQLDGCLWPHLRHPRNIIRGIPHQSLQINQLNGIQPLVLRLKCRFIINCQIGYALFRKQYRQVRLYQLQGIPVTCHHIGFHALRHCLVCQGADNVISLIPLQLQKRHAPCLCQLVQHRHLAAQLLRHRLPGSLVLCKHIRAEGMLALVKGNCQIIRPPVIQKLYQHVGKAHYGIGVHTCPGFQKRQGIIRPIQKTASIQDKKFLLVHDSLPPL